MATNNVTIPQERYQHLLECEQLATWFLNSVIVDSLPHIELTKKVMEEYSNNDKIKAIKAIFNQALNKED